MMVTVRSCLPPKGEARILLSGTKPDPSLILPASQAPAICRAVSSWPCTTRRFMRIQGTANAALMMSTTASPKSNWHLLARLMRTALAMLR